MINTEDKQAWCEAGLKHEFDFVDLCGSMLGLMANPAKLLEPDGKYAPDLISYRYATVADVKRITTPFFKAGTYGFNPSTTITINMKDLFRYQSYYPRIIIYFWVTWRAQEEYGVLVDSIDGVWATSLKTLFSINSPTTHTYVKRIDDSQGNAKSSLLVDLSKLWRAI